jgi:uncharacterized repeat protein (TIGR03943 family)
MSNVVAAPARSWSAKRLSTAVVTGAWAALFWFLLASGRTSLYLSGRTAWVVPVGAAILTAAFAGRVVSLRASEPEPFRRRDALALGVLVIPVLVVLVLPPASLTSFAASRRSSLSGASFVTSGGDVSTGDLSLVDVAGAMRTEEGRRALSARAGDIVTFTGFVTKDPGMPADEFVLTRFVISCCVADALSVEVRVAGAPPGRFEPDEWVRASGKLYPLSDEVILDATEIVRVERPEHPYISP